MKTDSNHHFNFNEQQPENASGDNLDRGVEKLIARELSDMIDYKSMAVDVQATRKSIKDSVISSTYFSSQQYLAKVLTEGAD